MREISIEEQGESLFLLLCLSTSVKRSIIYLSQIAIGKEEGRLLNQRETLVLIVEERFPDLRALAEQQVRLVNNIELLKTLARQLVVVQDTNKARQLLVEAVWVPTRTGDWLCCIQG